MIVRVGSQTQPDAVMAEIIVVQIQLQATLFIDGDVQRGVDGVTATEMHLPAVRRLADRGVGQGNLLIEFVFNAEVAAEHINIGNASADPQAGGFCAVT